jgi:hypothetical protein
LDDRATLRPIGAACKTQIQILKPPDPHPRLETRVIEIRTQRACLDRRRCAQLSRSFESGNRAPKSRRSAWIQWRPWKRFEYLTKRVWWELNVILKACKSRVPHEQRARSVEIII